MGAFQFDHPPQRVNVVGNSGSGKSTLARRLSSVLKLPYLEMDSLFWQPNWVATPDAEFREKIRHAIAGENWVLDGNYSRTTADKWERAQWVVWLDVPIWRSTYQVTRRCLHRCRSGDDLWPGCKETYRKAFASRESVIWWSVSQHRHIRNRYAACMQDPKFANLTFVRLRSQGETDELVNTLTAMVAS